MMLKKILLSMVGLLVLTVAVGIGVVKFNQYQNLELLQKDGLDGRLIAHKVNHLGKLEAILASGVRSFELDVIFRQSGGDDYFEIGHDDSEAQGQTLESYLVLLQTYQMHKIWIDVKNINAENADAILMHLEKLHQKYAIKHILLVETSSLSKSIKDISKAGYYTSYYLPTIAIHTLLRQQNKTLLEKEAQRIADLISVQGVKGISFPASLYAFVKKYVEPRIAQDIEYHTWNIIKFEDADALEQLKEKPLFQDERMRTIIYSYHYIS